MKIEKTDLRLDIGGYGKPGEGHNRGEEFTTVGLHETCEVRADMGALPWGDDTVEQIWSSHTLEHAPMIKINSVLKEWLRVLRPGKRAIVQVPNFDYVARYWLTGPNRAWAEQMVFGQQNNEGEFHKSAFTAMSLRADFEAAGFKVLRVEMRWTHNQETLQIVAEKPLGAPVGPQADL